MKTNLYNRIKEYIYILLGWKHMYSDLDWNKTYIKKCHTYEEKLQHKLTVLENYWHLKYIIKKNLNTWATKKISIQSFKDSIISK